MYPRDCHSRDVHHGDGTQNLFEQDPDVCFFSIHRFGDFFPGAVFLDLLF
jgi:acetoin utilization deacetylase AcuC-like enzyme